MKEVHCRPLRKKYPFNFTLLRIPFYLEPNYSEDAQFHESNHVRLKRKWGGHDAFETQKARHGLKERGEEVGISYFNLQRLASSTRLSHRLVQYMTNKYGITVSEALYAELNYNHFVLGQKLNDIEMLLDAADIAVERAMAMEHTITCNVQVNGNGFDRTKAYIYLKDQKAGTNVLEKIQKQLDQLGISSIPTFIIGGQYMIGGAARSDEFIDIFRQIEKEHPKRGLTKSVFGSTLNFSNAVLDDTLKLACTELQCMQ